MRRSSFEPKNFRIQHKNANQWTAIFGGHRGKLRHKFMTGWFTAQQIPRSIETEIIYNPLYFAICISNKMEIFLIKVATLKYAVT